MRMNNSFFVREALEQYLLAFKWKNNLFLFNFSKEKLKNNYNNSNVSQDSTLDFLLRSYLQKKIFNIKLAIRRLFLHFHDHTLQNIGRLLKISIYKICRIHSYTLHLEENDKTTFIYIKTI